MKTKKAFVRKEIDKIIRKEFSCFIMVIYSKQKSFY